MNADRLLCILLSQKRAVIDPCSSSDSNAALLEEIMKISLSQKDHQDKKAKGMNGKKNRRYNLR
jgi:hypothetical protein